jgi:hypothetical protein
MLPNNMFYDLVEKHFLKEENYILTRDEYKKILEKIIRKYKIERKD